MLIVTKRRYKKQHIIGGAGIFDTVANFVKRITTSNAAKAVVSKLASAAKSELGKKAIEAGKTATKQIGLHAIDVGKDAAVAKAKAIIDKALAPGSKDIVKQMPLTQKSKDTLASLISSSTKANDVAIDDHSSININKLLAGASVPNARKQNAVTIQDLVRRLNTGAGLRLA